MSEHHPATVEDLARLADAYCRGGHAPPDVVSRVAPLSDDELLQLTLIVQLLGCEP